MNRIVPPDSRQIPRFIDRELRAPLPYAEDLVGADYPEVGGVPGVQGVPDEVLQHSGGSPQPRQEPLGLVVDQVGRVATAGIQPISRDRREKELLSSTQTPD
jgi:hypothetical protein